MKDGNHAGIGKRNDNSYEHNGFTLYSLNKPSIRFGYQLIAALNQINIESLNLI